MKKLLILVMVLAMASLASATLKISVNGTVDPPDTEVILAPSDHAVIDVWGDGATGAGMFWLVANGPGTTVGGSLIYLGSLSSLYTYAPGTGDGWEDSEPGAGDGIQSWLMSLGYGQVMGASFMTLADGAAPPLPLQGTLVDGIDFHCEAPGDVVLSLISVDELGAITLFDSQIIHQIPIPEPVTIALLGLGGLLLRRRIA